MSSLNRLKWLIDVMARSSLIREEHYLFRLQKAEEFRIQNIDTRSSGMPTKHHNLYASIHLDSVFYAMRTIESMHGAMAAAFEFGQEECDLNKVVSILLEPGRRRLENIGNILTNDTVSDTVICLVSAIMNFHNEDKTLPNDFKDLISPTLSWVREFGAISMEYWNTFKTFRDAYAHNFRLIFPKAIETMPNKNYDNWIIGHLSSAPDLAEEFILVGEPQRIAMTELGRCLGAIERWVYTNILYGLLNGKKPILPRAVFFLEKENLVRYENIWNAQGYTIDNPLLMHKGGSDVSCQLDLHVRLMELRVKYGPRLVAKGKEGTEIDILSKYKKK